MEYASKTVGECKTACTGVSRKDCLVFIASNYVQDTHGPITLTSVLLGYIVGKQGLASNVDPRLVCSDGS